MRAALAATAVDVLAADGFVLGTPANIGYMSGALKHFFDSVYYPCLTAKIGAPYGVYVHGNNDTAGAMRGIESITKGDGLAGSARAGDRDRRAGQGRRPRPAGISPPPWPQRCFSDTASVVDRLDLPASFGSRSS